MNTLSAFNSGSFSMDRNRLVGRHRFHVPNSSLYCSCSAIPNKADRCPSQANKFPSRGNKFPPNFKHGLPKSRQANRNFAVKTDIPAKTQIFKREEVLKDIEIDGEVILHKASLLNFTDYCATVRDEVSELLGKKVYLQLVSSDQVDPVTGSGKTAKEPTILPWNPIDEPVSRDTSFRDTSVADHILSFSISP